MPCTLSALHPCTAANAREDERVGAMSPLHLNRHIHCTSILIRIVGNSFSLYCRMDVADCYLRQGAGGMNIAKDAKIRNKIAFIGAFKVPCTLPLKCLAL